MCGKHPTERSLCPTCQADPACSLATLTTRLNRYQLAEEQLQQLCKGCVGGHNHSQRAALFKAGEKISGEACQSLDCSVLVRMCMRVDFEVLIVIHMSHPH